MFEDMKAAKSFKQTCLLFFFLITASSLNATIPDVGLDSNEDIPEQEIISFARQLLGVKYRYGAASPTSGFDCSGFVYYVFKEFGIPLPRSSSAIGQKGEKISLRDAKASDIILFTGTNSANRTVGHVGIVVSNDDEKGLRFIHSSSGKHIQ